MKSNEQNKKTREYLVKIMGLVYDVHTQTKHHVFVEFSGHVDNVQVRYYLNGWDKNKEFDEALALFRKIREKNPHDNAAELYIARCRNIIDFGISKDWDGVETIKDKY